MPTVSARWLVLRWAMSWAVGENILRTNPLAGMNGPPRPDPRRHHTLEEVRQICAPPRARSIMLPASWRPIRARPGGGDCCSAPNKRSCSCVWPRTPGRGGASLSCSDLATSTAAC